MTQICLPNRHWPKPTALPALKSDGFCLCQAHCKILSVTQPISTYSSHIVTHKSSSGEIEMSNPTRRNFLAATGVAAATLLTSNNSVQAAEFTLPPLPYPVDALEPYIDAK